MAASNFPILRGADAQQSRVQDNVSALVTPVARALQNTPIMGGAAPAWILPTPLNGFAPPAVDVATLAFHRDCLGYVHVSGAMTHAAGTGALTTLFLLPLGYRQLRMHSYPVALGTGGTVAVRILASGEVQTVQALAAGTSIYVEFSFLAEG